MLPRFSMRGQAGKLRRGETPIGGMPADPYSTTAQRTRRRHHDGRPPGGGGSGAGASGPGGSAGGSRFGMVPPAALCPGLFGCQPLCSDFVRPTGPPGRHPQRGRARRRRCPVRHRAAGQLAGGQLIRFVRGYAAKVEHEKIKERSIRGRRARVWRASHNPRYEVRASIPLTPVVNAASGRRSSRSPRRTATSAR